MTIGLAELVHAYDGCKKLGLEKASKNLERVINKITKDLAKSTKVKREKCEKPETEPVAAAEETATAN